VTGYRRRFQANSVFAIGSTSETRRGLTVPA
jgi:hypothetical protein